MQHSYSGKTGDLHIESDPPGALVKIDGKLVSGTTPVTVENVAAGHRKITLRKEALFGRQKILLKPEDLLKVKIPLVLGTGALKVISNPVGADVYINNEKRDSTPCIIDDIPATKHSIRLEKKGFISHEDSVNINLHKTTTVSENLAEAAILAVHTKPPGASVALDEELVGETPIRDYAVLPRTYRIKITLPNYKPIAEKIILEPGKNLVKDFRLNHTEHYLDSVKTVRKIKQKRNQTIRRIVFALGTAAATGAGLYFNNQVASLSNEQRALQEAYDNADSDFDQFETEYREKGKDAAVSAQRRNILYVAGGACMLGFIVSIPF